MSDARSKIEAEIERDMQNAVRMGRVWDQIFSSMFDPPKSSIFRDHNCWKCKNGKEPCVAGSPNRCEYPHAKND